MAAGHRAVGHAASATVLAVHWRYLCTCLVRPGGLWFRVPVRHAHAALTTVHVIRWPCRCPQRSPQQRHRQQAHPRPHFSRSDRNGPRPLHSWSWQDTLTPLHSQTSPRPQICESNSLECGGSPPLLRSHVRPPNLNSRTGCPCGTVTPDCALGLVLVGPVLPRRVVCAPDEVAGWAALGSPSA